MIFITDKHTFIAQDKMDLKLVMERGKYQSVTVNNNPVIFHESSFDQNFIEGYISGFTKIGENVVIYEINYYQHDGLSFALYDPMATESLRNCLYYDTHIENIYLKGRFVVNKDMSISTKLPELGSDLPHNGYPFFKGKFIIEGTYDYNGTGTRILSFLGRFTIIKITLNGNTLPIVTSIQKDITKYLKIGKNKLVVEVFSSLRNLFGPHHCRDNPEPIDVFPFYSIFEVAGRRKGVLIIRMNIILYPSG